MPVGAVLFQFVNREECQRTLHYDAQDLRISDTQLPPEHVDF